MLNLIELIGKTIIRFSEELGKILILLSLSIKQFIIPPPEIKNTFKQMLEIGIKSLPVVLITAIFTGMVFALQTFTGFKRFGAESLVGTVVALSMTRELGPVLTGLIVMSDASLDKFLPRLKQDGLFLYDSSLIKDTIPRDDIEIVDIPATEIANKIGNTKSANMVLLGALIAKTGLLKRIFISDAIESSMPERKKKIIENNKKAIIEGIGYIENKKS